MATDLDRSFSLDVPPDRVVWAMRERSLIEASERARKALDVRITDLRSTPEVHEFEIWTRQAARTIKGRDPSKTEENRTVVTWDLKALTGQWVWSGPQGDKARVTGTYAVSGTDGGARLRLTAHVQIRVPVVGKMIEKKVQQGFQDEWPHYVERIRRWAAGEKG